MRGSDRTLFARQTCSALVITCSDFRFKRVEQGFIEAAGLVDDYDLIARPGGIRSLVLPRDEAARASMLTEMELLWRLHQFPRVLMMHHTSCRAYDDIASSANERETHAQHMATAAPIVERLLGGVRAEAYIIEPDDDRVLQVVAVAL